MVKVGLDFINETRNPGMKIRMSFAQITYFRRQTWISAFPSVHIRGVFAERHCVRIHINTEILVGQSFFGILWFWVII